MINVEEYAAVAVDKIIRSFEGPVDSAWWELTDALRKQRREEWLRMIKLQMRSVVEDNE